MSENQLIIQRLFAGETVIIEGIRLVRDHSPLKTGDMFAVQRSDGIHVFIAHEIRTSHCGRHIDEVTSESNPHSFHGFQCIKVRQA